MAQAVPVFGAEIKAVELDAQLRKPRAQCFVLHTGRIRQPLQVTPAGFALAARDLVAAAHKCAESSYRYNLSAGRTVHPDTLKFLGIETEEEA